jgi:ribose transport system ATP-binding protein
MLKAEGVTKSFGATQALRSVSFSASPGRILALVGENGSGKSTLMRIIAGEMAPDQGTVTWKGARPREVYLVHQELALCPHLTGAENIHLGTEKTPFSSHRSLLPSASHLTESLGYGHIDLSVPVHLLPVGQRQALEIARAAARQSEILLFDEPTSSLSAEEKSSLFRLLARLKESGVLVLYISHFLEEVREAADDVLILRDGEAVHHSSLKEISDEQIIERMVGRKVSEAFPRSPRNAGDVLLRVENLVPGKGRGKGASLEVRRGEALGLAGLTGAGRTELVRSIMKLDRPKAGGVRIKESSPDTVRGMWSQGAGYVSEERKTDGLALGLSVAENIALPSMKGLFWSDKRQDAQAIPWIKALRIKCQGPEQPIGRLSGGSQQKAALARLLQADCDLFILDEPTRGIDVGSKADIYRLIDEAAQRGCGILMTSSSLPELLGVCDRLAVMNRGALTWAGAVNETSEHELLKECIR